MGKRRHAFFILLKLKDKNQQAGKEEGKGSLRRKEREKKTGEEVNKRVSNPSGVLIDVHVM